MSATSQQGPHIQLLLRFGNLFRYSIGALCFSDYDIGFTLSRVTSFENVLNEKETANTVLYKKEKIEAAKHHCKGTYVVKEPGIFKLEFNNTHSWFNAKDLKYV